MSSEDPKKTAPKTLSDSDITTVHHSGRRGFLGLMAVGGAAGAAAALTGNSAQAQSTDSDNGSWTDRGGCGRGGGGIYTGRTDADNGNITDSAGYGRGAPYC
ncbi:hypothetical protein [Roseicyclus marinus]|jgi:hypothetical protein|uniref:Uncharacterized protein n=1 Tax=Roseicyclus marinus TaxID=2161673 RepID=A0AA48KJD4_9RHOB|nr:hypothetical protein MACH21_29640 [Roseicyclus marinus]